MMSSKNMIVMMMMIKMMKQMTTMTHPLTQSKAKEVDQKFLNNGVA